MDSFVRTLGKWYALFFALIFALLACGSIGFALFQLLQPDVCDGICNHEVAFILLALSIPLLIFSIVWLRLAFKQSQSSRVLSVIVFGLLFIGSSVDFYETLRYGTQNPILPGIGFVVGALGLYLYLVNKDVKNLFEVKQ
jgi:hypothetical protein